jgi:hypothetical protein
MLAKFSDRQNVCPTDPLEWDSVFPPGEATESV